MKKVVFILIASFLSLIAIAQPLCGFDAIHQNAMKKDPSYRAAIEADNANIRKYIAKNGTAMRTSSTTYTIPVVVHVVHTGGAVGTIYNPDDATIIATINYLNQVFKGTAAGMSGGVGDMGIEFVLAVRDPNCNATTGIDRVNGTSLAGYVANGVNRYTSNGVSDLNLKNQSRWNTANYYNIWVVNKIDGSDGTSGSFVGGYASLPGGSSSVDGTVLLATQMNVNKKTLPHEMGHAFNLFHTFEGSNDDTVCPINNNCNTDGDGVCDTDPVRANVSPAGVLNQTCRTGINPCTNTSYSINTENNFMGYTNCYTLFTAGQRDRVLATVLNSPSRISLVNSRAAVPCSNDANLSSLSISSVTISPAFSPTTFSYTANTTSNATIDLTVTKSSQYAKLEGRINGGSYITVTVSSITANLAMGDNIIDFKVTAENGTTINTYTTTIRRIPIAITSLSLASTPPGTSITINGMGFNTTIANNVVFFGNVRATVTAATATQITTTVPVAATYAPIKVLNTGTGSVAYSLNNFNPLYTPAKTIITATDFLAKQDFATGTSPRTLAMGDLDGDGKLDLVAVNRDANTISVFRNTSTSGSIGSGSFSAKQDFATGSTPQAVAIGDLDGDGKLDLAVTNFNSNSVSVFRNTATSGVINASSFAAKQDFATGSGAQSVAIGDLDGDGKLELATTNFNSNSVSVLRNTSTSGIINSSSFSAKQDFATSTQPVSLTISDLDGDGKLDFSVANLGSNTLSVLRNTANIGNITTSSFAVKQDFTTGTTPYSIVSGDIDGDGKPELIVVNRDANSVSIFRNTSTSGSINAGSFTAKQDFALGSVPQTVAIGDFNGDDKPDLAIVNFNSNTVSVFRNTASLGIIDASSFAGRLDFATGSGSQDVTVGDLDGDSRPDIVTANLTANTISVIRNASNNANLSALTTTAGSFSPSFSSGNINYSLTVNNATSTLTVTPTVAEAEATVQVRINNGTFVTVASGTESATLNLNVGLNPVDVRVTAQDGNTTRNYRINVTRSSLIPTITSFTPIKAKPGDAINISGSGFNISASNNIVFFGATRGEVTAATETQLTVTVPVGATYGAITVLNAESRLATNSLQNFTPVYSPTKAGITTSDFLTRQNFSTGASSGPISAAMGDIDGDGKPDLAIANSTGNSVAVFRNTSTNGSVSFANAVNFSVGSNPSSIAIGDFNGDGKLDIVVTCLGANRVAILRNTASSGTISASSFANQVNLTTGSDPYSVAIGDIDGDGKPDLATANYSSNTVSVFRNTNSSSGTISFSVKQDFPTGTDPYSVAIADIDGDTKLDLAVANFTSGTVSIYRNTATSGSISSSSFAIRQDFAVGDGCVSIAIGDLNGDNKPDLVVANLIGESVSILNNSSSIGTIGFNSNQLTPTNFYPRAIEIGDLDGDGNPDLAISNTNTITTQINTGSGDFNEAASFSAVGDVFSVVIGDVDGDGRPDLISANNISNNISVLRNATNIADLSALTLSTSTLSPTFAANTTSYTASVSNSTTSIRVTSTAADASATIQVRVNTGNYQTVTSGSQSNPLSLNLGANTIDVRVTAQNGTIKTYTITVTRVSNNANLSALSISSGTLSPAFESTTIAYTASLSNSTVSITPTIADVNATVQVRVNNGSYTTVANGNASNALALNVGSNTVDVLVTAQDGTTTKTYTITVTRIASSNANLTALAISAGSLSPVFASNSTSYTASVSNTTTSITVTPTVEDANATVQVRINNGTYTTVASGNSSGALALNVGSNTIDINVTAQDGSTIKTYNITVTRVSNNANLSSLTISSGVLSPAFTSNTTNYTASVNFTTTSITITPTVSDITAVVEVRLNNGSYTSVTNGNVSSALALNLGSNTLEVRVTAQDGTTNKTYSITVTREIPPTITSFTPTSAKSGDIVTIMGTGFNSTTTNNVVFFGATRATITSASSTSLTVTVPIGATYAPITILNTGTSLACYSQHNFTPTFTPAKTSITTTDFSVKQDFITGSNPQSVAIKDLDGDGKPDLVVANRSANTISVYRNISNIGNLGSGSFATKVDFITGLEPAFVAIDDLDGDGKPELVVANNNSTSVSVFHNTTTTGEITSNSFAAKVDFTTGNDPLSVAIGDIDGDGKPDLAVAHSSSVIISILRNISSAGAITSSSFATKVDFVIGSTAFSVAIGDLDGDAKPDLALAIPSLGSISVLRNTSTAGAITSSSFATKVDFPTGSFTNPSSLVIGDLDGDSKPDLAVANASSLLISVFRNTSTIGAITSNSFAAKVDFVVTTSPTSIAIGDLDGDGKPDLAVANNNLGNSLSVLRNTSTVGAISSSSFTDRVLFTAGSSPRSIAIGDLDGDGKPDLAVANYNANTTSILRNTSNNANLTSLTISSGSLSPAFTSNITSYSTSVSNSTTSITITPTVEDANATLQVRINNGTYTTVTSGSASGSLALNEGNNTIDVLVTAQNAITKMYSVTVNRPALTSITSFTPSSGPIGSLVTIVGANLNNPTSITIGGVAAIPISNDGSTLVVMVMPGATTGAISVTTAGNSANGSSNFTVSTSQTPNTQLGNKLVGTNNTGAAGQGVAIALSADGSTAIVGGYADNSNAGAAWIYVRSGNSWIQQGTKLVGTGATGNAWQGMAVSISADGNTAVVGGPYDNNMKGAAWIFTRNGSTWTQQGNKLVASDFVGNAFQGIAVSISADGNTVAVGGNYDNSNRGAAWIYTRANGTWTQQGSKLIGTGAIGNAQQGTSVSLSADGNTLAVGGIDDNNVTGATWIYTRSGNVWTQEGNKLVGTGVIGNSRQGHTVAISADGNTVAVGGIFDNSSVGATWIFTRTSGVWSQQGNKLVGTAVQGSFAHQGSALSISADGNTILVGGYADNNYAGAAWLFTRNGSTWKQQAYKWVGTGATLNSYQGRSVAISADGNIAMVGGSGDNSNQGAVWVYTLQTAIWNGITWINGYPNPAKDAIIASSNTPYGFECKNLTINSGVSLTNTYASISGDIINNGNGITGTGNLVIAANCSLSGNMINFSGNLTVNSDATLTTNNLLTLTSSATNTARIGNSAGTISGNVTVQRYIPGGRRVYRFLSHPFTSNLDLSSLTDNIDITGSGGSPMTTTATNAPSAFGYDNAGGNSSLPSDPGWTALTASSTFNSKTGYRILVRGSKGQTGSLTGGTYTPAPVTLDWTGALNQGNQVVTLTNNGANRDYTLVGNPYASPVDLSLITRGSSINANFSVWNANAGSRGAYVTQPFSTSYILPSGGAFFTQSSANTNNTITFTEASKSSGTPSSVFRTTASDEVLTLQVKDNNGNYADQLMFLFNNDHYTAAYDALWDGNKLVNPEVNFYSMSSDVTKLAIDRRAKDTAAIKLGFTTTALGNYSFEVKTSSTGSGNMYYLRDKHLNTETLLQINTTVSFTVTSDSATQGDNRFEIVMRNSNALPVTFLNVTAAQKNAGIEVTWNTANEVNMNSYEVEASKDGVTFTKATTIAAKNATTNNYSWLDASVINGDNYYRIKAVENNGTIKYSNVVKVKIGGKGAEFTVYPNPVKGGVISLQMSNAEKVIYTVKIYNNIGQEVASKIINHNGGSTTQTIDLGKTVAAGTYKMYISNGTTSITKTVIVE